MDRVHSFFRKKKIKLKNLNKKKCFYYICFRKCLCCFPVRCGVAFLICLQMSCMTPFTVLRRNKYATAVAISCMTLLATAAIFYMYAVTWEKPAYITGCLYLSFPCFVFHFVMLDKHYSYTRSYEKKYEYFEKFVLGVDITAIVSYFYFVFMLQNSYNKMNEKLAQRSSSRISTL